MPKRRRRSKKRRRPAASLTDDLVVEILSRLPIKSLCRFRCVSRTWRNLISHPDYRCKLPQTLAGFFYSSANAERSPMSALHFSNVSGKGWPFISPSFSFLPSYKSIALCDCCNGLLLLRVWEFMSTLGDFHYAVCNPATKKWVRLPDSTLAVSTAHLGFDPTVLSHFHVFLFGIQEHGDCDLSVEVYSSEAQGWVHKEDGWDDDIYFISFVSRTVFFNNYLHFITNGTAVAVVDKEGKTLRNIPVPHGMNRDGFIQLSQGYLHYAVFERDAADDRLAVYILQDYDSQEWVLKHSIGTSYIFGRRRVDLQVEFDWVAIHPECNTIFFTLGRDKTLMSYDMDRRQVQVIRNLGHDSGAPYLPCVPLYS